MIINWAELEEKFGGSYAGVGTYKVKVKDVVVNDKSPKGSCRVDINYEKSNGLSYPKTSYFLSFKEGANVGWRQIFAMILMKALCGNEEDAKKVVDSIESKEGDDAIISAYKDSFKRLGDKHREVEIEVYSQPSEDGREFTRSQLTADGKLSTKRNDAPKKVDSVDSVDDLGGEEIDLSDVPF